MYLTRLSKVLSVVLISLVSSIAWTVGETGEAACVAQSGGDAAKLAACIAAVRPANNLRCENLVSEIKKAKDELQKKCSGIRKSDISRCTTEIGRCAGESQEDTEDQFDALTGATDASLMNLFTRSAKSDNCPRKTTEEMQKDKDKVDDLMKENADRIKSTREKSDEIMNDFNKQKESFQNSEIEFLHKAEQLEVETEADIQAMISKTKDNVQKLSDEIMAGHNEVANLKSAMLNIQAEKVALVEKLASDCTLALEKRKEEIRAKIDAAKAGNGYKAGSINGLGGYKSYWQKNLKEFYSKCVDNSKKQMKLAAVQVQGRFDDAKAKLARAENKIAQTEQKIKDMKAELVKATELKEKKASSDQKRIMNSLQLSANRLAELASSANKAQANVDAQNNMAMMQMLMSGQTYVGSATAAVIPGIKNTVEDAAAEWGKYQSASADFGASSCCKGNTDYVGLCESNKRSLDSYQKAFDTAN